MPFAASASSERLSRRRKLPASFELTSLAQRHRVARMIQRGFRRWRFLRAQVDPFSLAPIPLPFAFVLVEKDGVQHAFDVREYVRYLLKTACFCNPFSRRPLEEGEVARLLRTQPRGLRAVLRATYLCQAELQRFALEVADLDRHALLSERVDSCLEAMLEVAERHFFDFSIYMVKEHLKTYEALLEDLFEEDARRTADLQKRHVCVMKQRGILCPPEVLEYVKDVHCVFQSEPSAGEEADAPPLIPLLQEWATHRLRFK